MRHLAEACEAIASTTKKLVKTGIVADYLKSRSTHKAAVSAIFLSGQPFPAWEETTLQVGGRSLWPIVAELSGKDEAELTAAYRRSGDLGAVAGDVLPPRPGQGLDVVEVERAFRQIAGAHGPAPKATLVRDLLARDSSRSQVHHQDHDRRSSHWSERKPGRRGSCSAFGSTQNEVQRANMLVGDIGETVRLAAEGKLSEAKMRLFHPLGFMLASPIESPEEGLSYFPEAAVEDKYDGIRAQAHVSGGEVKFFSRTRDEITESFPELPGALAGLPQDAILDGEIVAWEYEYVEPEHVERALLPATAAQAAGLPVQSSEVAVPAQTPHAPTAGRARPFSVLQQRLGRKKVSDKMLREIPVAFLIFDVLYARGDLVIDRPLRERAQILDELLSAERVDHHRVTESQRRPGQGQLLFEEEEEMAAASVIRAPVFRAASPEELEELFAAAQVRGNEGLMIKDLNSAYTPGKRGKSWLKMKRELATLDVVVTAVEYGHGKRIGVLSDYTFAVWDTNEDHLVNIGKAYSGLTDAEIAKMTEWFLAHTVEDQGFRRVVEPKIVLEVAFNNMMRSDRHASGYALRFPQNRSLAPR